MEQMPQGAQQQAPQGEEGGNPAIQMVQDIGSALGTLQNAMAQGGAPKPIVDSLGQVLQAYDQFVATLTGGGGQEPAGAQMNTPEQGGRGGAMPVG